MAIYSSLIQELSFFCETYNRVSKMLNIPITANDSLRAFFIDNDLPSIDKAIKFLNHNRAIYFSPVPLSATWLTATFYVG